MHASFALWFLGILAVLAFIATTAGSMPFRGGTITTGTVVSADAQTSSFMGPRGRTRMRTYAPVVEYIDSAGTKYTVTSSLSGGVQPQIGEQVKVSYLPSRPDKARILNRSGTRAGRYLFLIVGVGFLVAASMVH